MARCPAAPKNTRAMSSRWEVDLRPRSRSACSNRRIRARTGMAAALGGCPGNHGERGERAGERERQAQRRPTRRACRHAAGGRSEQPSGSAAAAALPRIVRRSRHDYPDSLLLVVPELPEVETVVRCLAPELVGRRVVGVSVRETRLRGGVAPDFAERLSGRRIEGLARRGKYLLAALDDGRLWLVHLGMTGRLTLAPPGRADERHDHVVVRLDDGRVLTFNDARRFGRVAVVERAALAAETGAAIDPLDPGFTAGVLFALTRGRRTSIKALLMDQRRVAGLGNIYVNELLFRAGIRPGRRASRLRRRDCARLVRATRAVLDDAIRRGGSSVSDYRDGLGRPGWFQLHHRVYDRPGEPCRRCAEPIRARVIVGPSSLPCPGCQVEAAD